MEYCVCKPNVRRIAAKFSITVFFVQQWGVRVGEHLGLKYIMFIINQKFGKGAK